MDKPRGCRHLAESWPGLRSAASAVPPMSPSRHAEVRDHATAEALHDGYDESRSSPDPGLSGSSCQSRCSGGVAPAQPSAGDRESARRPMTVITEPITTGRKKAQHAAEPGADEHGEQAAADYRSVERWNAVAAADENHRALHR